ncbi:MAG: hypothetical protein ACYC7H_07260 [Chloroflexota bacterium]
MFRPGDVRLAHFSDEHIEAADLVTAAKVLALVAREGAMGSSIAPRSQ